MSGSKFEKLIEYVIANDDKRARTLFHQIVVDKSRKIYEALDIDDTERAFDDVEADHTASGEEFGGDAADDLESDVFVDGEEEGFDGEGEESLELNPEIDDRVADLEAEFDTLKAEFEELLHAEEGTDEGEEEVLGGEEEELEGLDSAVEDEGEENFEDFEDESEGEESSDEDESEEEEEEKEEPVDESVIREYVLKVTKGLANSTEEGSVNKKSVATAKPSIVPSVSAKNLNKGGTSEGRPNPKSGEFTSDKIQNRPGGSAGVKSLKPAPKPDIDKEDAGINKKSIES